MLGAILIWRPQHGGGGEKRNTSNLRKNFIDFAGKEGEGVVTSENISDVTHGGSLCVL